MLLSEVNTVTADEGSRNEQRIGYDYLVLADNDFSELSPLPNKVLNLLIRTSKDNRWKYNRMILDIGRKIQVAADVDKLEHYCFRRTPA